MTKVIVEGKEYTCFAPEECTTPKGTFIENPEKNILIKNDQYVLAKIHYRGEQEECLAIRWNVSDREKDEKVNEKCIGYPNIRGKPTWFVLPDKLLQDIQQYLLTKQK